jgi:hypothetical protein
LSKAYRAYVHESRIDPEGYTAKANRRNNAETGNHAFRTILGDQIYSKSALAQRCKILCTCIAYNMIHLVLFEVERGADVDFAGRATRLAEVNLTLPNAEVRTETAGEK